MLHFSCTNCGKNWFYPKRFGCLLQQFQSVYSPGTLLASGRMEEEQNFFQKHFWVFEANNVSAQNKNTNVSHSKYSMHQAFSISINSIWLCVKKHFYKSQYQYHEHLFRNTFSCIWYFYKARRFYGPHNQITFSCYIYRSKFFLPCFEGSRNAQQAQKWSGSRSKQLWLHQLLGYGDWNESVCRIMAKK